MGCLTPQIDFCKLGPRPRIRGRAGNPCTNAHRPFRYVESPYRHLPNSTKYRTKKYSMHHPTRKLHVNLVLPQQLPVFVQNLLAVLLVRRHLVLFIRHVLGGLEEQRVQFVEDRAAAFFERGLKQLAREFSGDPGSATKKNFRGLSGLRPHA